MSTSQNKNLSTPDIPASAAVFTVSATIRINASASLVYRTLRNTETWKDWNRFVPRVTITHQPPDTDDATQGEIEEIVRNTSIAGGMDSDITEGIGLSGTSNRRPQTPQNQSAPSPGPVIRQRLASNASRLSTQSTTSEKDPTSVTTSTTTTTTTTTTSTTNGVRSASIPSDKPSTPATTTTTTEENTSPPPRRRGSLAAAAPTTSPSSRGLTLLTLYGEPSVRLQPGTKLTFHVCMKLPSVKTITNEISMIVTEVSRPDSDTADEEKSPFSNPFSGGGSRVPKSKPHTTSPPLYRIVWGGSSNYDPPRAFPKFLLQAQRVHEIRPITTGDGRDDVMCEYRSWESQRGMLAKRVAKKYEKYIQDRFVEWNEGIRDFCESMGGAVERRDFSISN